MIFAAAPYLQKSNLTQHSAIAAIETPANILSSATKIKSLAIIGLPAILAMRAPIVDHKPNITIPNPTLIIFLACS